MFPFSLTHAQLADEQLAIITEYGCHFSLMVQAVFWFVLHFLWLGLAQLVPSQGPAPWVVLAKTGMAVGHLALKAIPCCFCHGCRVTQLTADCAWPRELWELTDFTQCIVSYGGLPTEGLANALTALFSVADDNILQGQVPGQAIKTVLLDLDFGAA